MRQRFDDILNECIRRLEAPGGDIEAVLSRYPEHADELRPYLEVWTSLSVVEQAQASSAGAIRGRQQLLAAIARAEQPERGVSLTNSLPTKGGLSMGFVSMRLVAAFVAGVALALGTTFLTGNLGSSGGSSAEAGTFAECIAALDFNGDGDLTVEDVRQFADAIDVQAPAFDVDQDGDVDINDVVAAVGGFVACFQNLQPPVPTVPPALPTPPVP